MGIKARWRTFAFLAIGSLALPALAQSDGDPGNDKSVVVDGAESNPSDPVRVRLLLHDPEAKNEVREVSAGTDFFSGDRFRVNITSKTAGYYYLLLEDSSGRLQVLYPMLDRNGRVGDNAIRRNASQVLPANNWFRFDDNPGDENLYLVVAPQRIRDLDRAIQDDDSRVSGAMFDQFAGQSAAKGIEYRDNAGNRETRNVTTLRLRHLP